MREQCSLSDRLQAEVPIEALPDVSPAVRNRRLCKADFIGSRSEQHLHNLHKLQLVQGFNKQQMRRWQLLYSLRNPQPSHDTLHKSPKLRPFSAGPLHNNAHTRYSSLRLHLEK